MTRALQVALVRLVNSDLKDRLASRLEAIINRTIKNLFLFRVHLDKTDARAKKANQD